jgi:hypothetical protein
MVGVRSLAAGIAVLVLLVIAQAAMGADQPPASSAENATAHLQDLLKQQVNVAKDMTDKMASFSPSVVNNSKENVDGLLLSVTISKDKNGNVLKTYYDPNGKTVETKMISAGNGPVLTTTYNPDGSVQSEQTFEPVGLVTYKVIHNSDGTETATVQDASLPNDNTLTYQVDTTGNVVPGSEKLSTTPGLPPGSTYCQNTGQYELNGPAPK